MRKKPTLLYVRTSCFLIRLITTLRSLPVSGDLSNRLVSTSHASSSSESCRNWKYRTDSSRFAFRIEHRLNTLKLGHIFVNKSCMASYSNYLVLSNNSLLHSSFTIRYQWLTSRDSFGVNYITLNTVLTCHNFCSAPQDVFVVIDSLDGVTSYVVVHSCLADGLCFPMHWVVLLQACASVASLQPIANVFHNLQIVNLAAN